MSAAARRQDRSPADSLERFPRQDAETFLNTPGARTHLPPPGDLALLTARELEVMALAAEGQSNHEIAGKLVVSPLTVRTHIQCAMTKLNAGDRAQLVVIAYQSGLVRPVTPPH